MSARIVGSCTLLMATASGKLAVVKILTVNGFSVLEKVTFSSGVIPCLSWSLKKAGELMGPSVNTDFLDDLREMLGDEQFTALIAKYHEKESGCLPESGPKRLPAETAGSKKHFMPGQSLLNWQKWKIWIPGKFAGSSMESK